VRRHVIYWGLAGGTLITVLQIIDYRWLVVERSVEIYGALVAAIFASVGIWLGRRLTRPRERVVVREVPIEVPVEVRVEVPVAGPFVRNDENLVSRGITPRELEMLELIAAGLSTREIAGRVGISENTVKTHSSRIFDKLGARRRTQAVQLAKELRLIP
jgi:DNA-binding CsgD family transcriptional regulator